MGSGTACQRAAGGAEIIMPVRTGTGMLHATLSGGDPQGWPICHLVPFAIVQRRTLLRIGHFRRSGLFVREAAAPVSQARLGPLLWAYGKSLSCHLA